MSGVRTNCFLDCLLNWHCAASSVGDLLGWREDWWSGIMLIQFAAARIDPFLLSDQPLGPKALIRQLACSDIQGRTRHCPLARCELIRVSGTTESLELSSSSVVGEKAYLSVGLRTQR